MRNAAMILGVIAGLIAMVIGFFSYGYTVVVENHGEIDGVAQQVSNVQLIRITSFLAPLLALVGGAMAKMRALWGGALMLIAGGLMYHAFGFGVFTMFPIGFCIAGGVLALAAGKPDEAKAHF